MMAPDWLWIPVTLFAAFAQTIRNAAQRHLTPIVGTLGATLVRFLYGLPFALAWALLVYGYGGYTLPTLNVPFLGWVLLGSVTQIGATALLLRVMAERNFALGIAYSKTEVLQIGVFGLAFLGDPLTFGTLTAIALSTAGLLLLAPADPAHPLRAFLTGWTTRPALMGIVSGAGFGLASVGYRGAALALGDTPYPAAAATTLVAAQTLQTLLLGGWLLARQPAVVRGVIREWRKSLFAGCMGAAASAGWFTAVAIEPAAHVRTLGLVEILFGYVLARRIFREHISARERAGIVLLLAGLAGIMLH